MHVGNVAEHLIWCFCMLRHASYDCGAGGSNHHGSSEEEAMLLCWWFLIVVCAYGFVFWHSHFDGPCLLHTARGVVVAFGWK